MIKSTASDQRWAVAREHTKIDTDRTLIDFVSHGEIVSERYRGRSLYVKKGKGRIGRDF